MIDLQRTEKRVFSGNAEDGYRAFFGALEALDIEPRLAPAEATRVVGVLTTLYARHSLSAARFEQVIGHGATLRHIIARSGFQSAAHLLGVVATQGADGSHRIEKPDQLEKLLSLSSVKHTPATLLGLIPKLRPQAALQVSLLLLSDPDIAQAPQIRAFVQGLAGLFEQLEVNDALIPIFGPAFQGADSFADPASIRRALQSTLGRWVAAQDWPPFSGNNEDGPKVVVSAEALEGRGDDTVFFGPYDHVPGYVRTERATPRVGDARSVVERLEALNPQSVQFWGRETPWWLLLLAHRRLAPQQYSRHVDLYTEATPFEPEPNATDKRSD